MPIAPADPKSGASVLLPEKQIKKLEPQRASSARPIIDKLLQSLDYVTHSPYLIVIRVIAWEVTKSRRLRAKPSQGELYGTELVALLCYKIPSHHET